jgi:hypothetical protein
MAEVRATMVAQRPPSGVVGDVEMVIDGARSDLRRHRAAERVANIRENNKGAFVGEEPGRLGADAPARAGDERDPVCHPVHNVPRPARAAKK